MSAGVEPIITVHGSRNSPDPKYFIGVGKAEEIKQSIDANEIEIVLFNHALMPSQERNLEKLFECRVLDRTGVILDIFALRAQSFEGKLQVELAQLKHLSTRLVRGWTHLERQKGGIGLRGPGESQLETDRRLIGHRIKKLNQRLDKLKNQRDQGRKQRKKASIPIVSLVGYTNAGKSTLFNTLTESDVYAKDQLFATLDPTLRKLKIKGLGDVIFVDTVGFIKDLPHDLVAAFQSTLQETIEADLLLHVIDASNIKYEDSIYHVNEVLEEIDASSVPQMQVYNKIDLLENDSQVKTETGIAGIVCRQWLSAKTGDGIAELQQNIVEYLAKYHKNMQVTIPPNGAELRAKLYEKGLVIKEDLNEEGEFLLQLQISQKELPWLEKSLQQIA